jgi:hypothetical protein
LWCFFSDTWGHSITQPYQIPASHRFHDTDPDNDAE